MRAGLTIILEMYSRFAFAVFAVLVVVIICASSIWLVPAGQGPFSASHGPVSALRARRAALRLMNWISALVSFVLGSAAIGIGSAGRRERAELTIREIAPPVSLFCPLQC